MNTPSRPTWLFNSGTQFSGNPKWLFLHVNEHRDDIDAWWITSSKATVDFVRSLGHQACTFDSAQAKRLMTATSVYVVDQVKEHLPDELHSATLLNLWHGVGVKAIERAPGVGYDNHRIARKYIRYNRILRNNQLFLVTSPFMEEHFRDQVDLDEEVLIRGGYPQNVYQREHGPVATFDHDLRARKGLGPDTRIALYAPTWRRDQAGEFLHEALPDLAALDRALEQQNTLLIVKMHPRLAEDPIFRKMRTHFEHAKHLLFWDNAEDVYEVLPQIDLGIVDYSSIHYDLLAAGVRRFIRYAFDLDAFADNVRPGFSYEDLSCGTLATSFEDLLAALAGDNLVEPSELQRVHDLFWSYSGPGDLDAIVERAKAFEHRDVPLPTLYSFDVFDTVLHRRGVEPISAFHHVSHRMRTESVRFPQALVNRFVQVRVEAEVSARNYYRRQEPRRRAGRLEIGFAEIYERIAELYDLDEQQVDTLMRWEVEAELGAVLPDRAVVERIEELVAAGEKVVLISDMYLPNEVLRRILAAADPVLADLPLYLSNDHGVQKATGRLFLKVYEDVRYDFREWQHVGDNPYSDIAQADALGITATQVPRPELSRYTSSMTSYLDSYDGYLVAGMVHEHERTTASSVDRFAYSYVAPYLVPYVAWLLRNAVERGIERLYFVARDGHHMRPIADALIAEWDLPLKTSYLYGSRRAWRLASQIHDLDEDIFHPHGNFSGAHDPATLLDAAHLDASRFEELFPEFADLLRATEIDAESLGDLLRAMRASAPFRAHLLSVGAAERPLVLEYLAQEIDPDESFAFVEYWGRGYTQDCLARLLQEAFGPDTETRMYYARSINPSSGASIRYDFTAARFPYLAVEAIFANLPYATVRGYETRDGRVEPVTRARPFDADFFEACERELPRFARDYAALPALDRNLLDHDLFRFAFRYHRRRPGDPYFTEHLAPLRYSDGYGSAENEYAPAFNVPILAKVLVGGEPPHRFTRSTPMSLARSSRVVRLAYRVGTSPRTARARAALTRAQAFGSTLNRMLMSSRG